MTDENYCKEVARIVDSGAKKLPLRVFRNGDKDVSWALGGDGMPSFFPHAPNHLMAKIVPRYQSGWEGCGIWLHADVDKNNVSAIAAAELLLNEAREKIKACRTAVSFARE